MIGWLRGVLRDKRPPYLLLDVQGVGYEVEAPMTTFYDLPEPGGEVALYTHHVVREDAQQLFGFSRPRERDVFRMLLRVNGVGGKVALAILSGMDADSLARCVYEGDTAALVRLPGVGKKTAERLVIEMRDRLDVQDAAPGPVGRPASVERPVDAAGEAAEALVALGFKPQEASRRVRAVDEEGLACEELVRRALQAAGGR